MPLHCWTSARYTIPLPAGHRFPIEKYALLRDAVLASGLVAPSTLHEPERASLDALRLVHTERYIDALVTGTLSDAEQRRIGLPWSEFLVERSFRADVQQCNGTLGVGVRTADSRWPVSHQSSVSSVSNPVCVVRRQFPVLGTHSSRLGTASSALRLATFSTDDRLTTLRGTRRLNDAAGASGGSSSLRSSG